VFLGPNLIVWCSRKQPTVFKPSTEAEYRAIGHRVAETIWVLKLLYDLGISLPTTVHLYCDNLGSTYMFVNPVQHDRSKRITVDYHFVQEWIVDGDLVIRHISTRLQVANIFTKGLSSQQFLLHKNSLSVCPPDQIEGA